MKKNKVCALVPMIRINRFTIRFSANEGNELRSNFLVDKVKAETIRVFRKNR